jgi:hypothetical protein
VSAKGNDAFIPILAYGDIFEAAWSSDLRMPSETSGDFVVPEHPKRLPTIKSVSKVTNDLVVFMFLLLWR